MHRAFLWFLGVALCGTVAAEQIDYPPATRLKHQVLLTKQPDERADTQTRPHISLVQRGYEAIAFALVTADAARTQRWVIYDTAQKKITALAKAPETPAPKPGQPPAAEEKLQPGVKKEHLDRWVMWDNWRNQFNEGKREDLIEQAKLQEGYTCFAKEGATPEAVAELFIHRPAAGDPVRLCALEKYEGQMLNQVVWLRVLRSGDIAVLAANAKATVLQVYEMPLLATICAQWNALTDHAWKETPAVKARYLGSLYEFSEYADRAFDAILVASDGKAYFGTMSHHSTEGSPVFSFDPKAEKFALLGDIDRMYGPRQAGTAGSMVHSNAFEMNGKVYFTGEDPHYSDWNFPLEPGQEKPKYLGSPIVEYDPKTGNTRGVGIPFADKPGLFRLNGDARRNVLYVRRGYARDYAGPLTWYAVQLDANGNMAGEPRPFPLPLHPPEIVVAADGTIFAAIPEPKAYAELTERKARKEKTEGIAAQCEVYRLDPELRKAERVATLPDTWEIHWLPWQDGKPAAIGIGGRFVYRLNTQTGAIEKTVPWPKLPQSHEGPSALYEGKILHFLYTTPKTRAGRTTAVYTVDLATGKALFHGVVVDEAGRRTKDLNHFTILPDGKILGVGTVYGLPTDRHSMARYRDGEPYRLDCAGFLIEKLPAGTPVQE